MAVRERDVSVDGSGGLTVGGVVHSADRGALGGLRVTIVDRNVGDDHLLGEAVTDDRGRFTAHLDASVLLERGKTRPDLQARAYAGETLLGSSDVRYNAGPEESLEIRVPTGSAGLPSEYETLVGRLAPHYGGPLHDLQETEQRPDVTYLANKTGWDARAVALAALASRFGTHATAGGESLDPALYYALFRAGLPADPVALYATNPGTVAAVWKHAIEQGMIPAGLGDGLAAAEATFRTLAGGRVLDATAFPGGSTVAELARGALGDDRDRHETFARLLVANRGNPRALWASVRRELGAGAASRLQLDGRLARLTLDNAPLVERLHDAEPELSSPVMLVQRGYYQPERWLELVEGEPPPVIQGESGEERRGRYAELLAAQIRLSFPTAVVAARLGSGELKLTEDDDLQNRVRSFLSDHQGSFELGAEPVDHYVETNGLAAEVPDDVLAQVKRLQRVFQISASDEAMTVLFANGLDSAYSVAAYDEDEFADAFAGQLGGEEPARRMHAKAGQVHHAVLQVATSYLLLRNAPAIGADAAAPIIAGPPPAPPAAAAPLAVPTLEALFGSLDYCACEHCRSVLSPAAYLVDLLLMLDRPEEGPGNPQKVLLDRRPDIGRLSLTCENTNTPVPTIDLITETLEYFVANNLSIAGYGGHDTGDRADREELLASPQYVDESVYTALQTASFPTPLPFHKSLETLRRLCAKLDIPLVVVLERLLATPNLVERPNDASYAWRDILMERAGLSREQYRLLTDRNITLQELFGYPAATASNTVRSELRNVRRFTRRAGITIENLAEILRTAFVNPNSVLLPRLERLRVSFATLAALEDGTLADADFDALLPTTLDAGEYGGDVKAWVRDPANFARIMSLVTIGAPQGRSACDAEQLELCYSSPDPAANALAELDFVKVARFIRLWRSLGWTIRETDDAIVALFSGTATTAAGLDTGFLALLPRLGVVLELLDRLRLRRGRDMPQLLACWSPIATAGPDSLYRRLFLRPGAPGPDPAFAEDEYGDVLDDAAVKLLAHAETLRAAFNLTSEELTAIVDALGYDATTPLTLANVSAVHRRGWLARALRISVRELLLLIRRTGLDPFAAPDPPRPAVMRLVDLLEELAAARLKPAQALYLLFDDDLGGRARPDLADVLELAGAMRAGADAIEREFTVVDDPSGDIARARMTLVYGAEATDFFFGLLGETLAVFADYAHTQATLSDAVLDVAPGRLAYDHLRKQLTFSGVMTTEIRDDLKAVANVGAAFRAAVDDLYDAGQQAIAAFFARYTELEQLFDDYVDSTAAPEERRTALLAAFLPELRRRRIEQQALALVAGASAADPVLARTVLADAAVMHAEGAAGRAALRDVVAAARPGLAVHFYWSGTVTGAPDDEHAAVSLLEYAAGSAQTLPANPTAGDPISGVWSGYIEAPEGGFYDLTVDTDAGASVTVSVEGREVTMADAGGTWTHQDPIELAGGVLHALEITAEGITDTFAVRWESTGRGREVIPAALLYSETLVADLRAVHERFLKAASLASVLRLTPAELAFLATHPDLAIGGEGWLNALPVTGRPLLAVNGPALRDVLVALLDFVRVRDTSARGRDDLVTLLADPTATLPDGSGAVETLLGWDAQSLDALLTHFGLDRGDLGEVAAFRRVHDAYALVKTSGIPPVALITAATNAPTATAVSGLEAALRARHDHAEALEVVRSISDELRDLRRDALVAHILHGFANTPAMRHIDTADKLFELFLMDVEMAACAQTSRIRHALSAVQLFTERCLMNLEPLVGPGAIPAQRWEWMKRYRVWEANRKVFLWPENWLEPELRDDQSPFFREAMSELLQSDITEDTAAIAVGTYLSKLGEVAQLEPCGLHYVAATADAGETSHVIARTAGARRKHYYRRRDGGSWTPWETVELDIEDVPVAPVVWRDRLLLFWLKIIKETPTDAAALPTTGPQGAITTLTLGDIKTNAQADASLPSVSVRAVLCWSEYVQGRWLPSKTSDPNRPASLGRFTAGGSGAFERDKLRFVFHERYDGALAVLIRGSGSGGFVLYNTHSLPLLIDEVPYELWPPVMPAARTLERANGRLKISYVPAWPWAPLVPIPFVREVLDSPLAFATLQSEQFPAAEAWTAPMLVSDSRKAYYVRTQQRAVSLQLYGGFGVVLDDEPVMELDLSDLIVVDLGFPPKPDDPPIVIEGPDFGVVDPLPVERFVIADRDIHTALRTGFPVSYGEVRLGPDGPLPGIQTRNGR